MRTSMASSPRTVSEPRRWVVFQKNGLAKASASIARAATRSRMRISSVRRRRRTTRRDIFRTTVIENALFLGKWLLLAYLFEAMMLHYIPSDWIASVLGGDGLQPILLGALVGGPAYLNGFAAVPMVHALLEQGMSNGAAMSFVIAGGVSCIPAAIAVWALVKPRIFFAYIAIAMTGAVIAGILWNIAA